jgi:hypothetical protein
MTATRTNGATDSGSRVPGLQYERAYGKARRETP